MSKKILFIIPQDNFIDEELLIPRDVLSRRGIIITVASKTRHKATGKRGTEITPDLALPEVNSKDFDAAVFVGASGARQFDDDMDAFKLARQFQAAGKVVGAISISVSTLANAGILISKTVTGFPTEEENIKNKGAAYTGMPVEIDGHIVTAKDPATGTEFAEQVAFLLEV